MRCCKLAGEFVFLCYLGHGIVADEKRCQLGLLYFFEHCLFLVVSLLYICLLNNKNLML